MSRYLIRRIEENPAIVLRTQHGNRRARGERPSRARALARQSDRRVETRDIRHVFVMTGAVPEHALARRLRRARRQRVHQDRAGPVAGRPGRRALAARPAAASARNESARRVRGRRRPRRQHQTRRVGGRRGLDRDRLRASGAARMRRNDDHGRCKLRSYRSDHDRQTRETPECDECVKIGGRWVHLRTCQECGATRCCDDSPNRHASEHARASGIR